MASPGGRLEEWPRLPVFGETKTIHVDIQQWPQHRCPPELATVPAVSLPTVVRSILRESTQRERYVKTPSGDSSAATGYLTEYF